ncbi:MAG: sugar phosphate isomerase/epimerase [Candidatus Methanoperedens sp.]|nr:sugar phosphate isomerase/epimerase [Candidatus Methanoperedens sp.]
MKLSCASLFLWDYSVPEIMEILLEAGIESVEFWAETPDFWNKRNSEKAMITLVDAISTMPGGCNLHVPILDLNPSSYNDLVHEATVIETLWSLDLAKRIGAKVVTIHAGKRTVHRTPTNEDREKFRKYLMKSLEKAYSLDLSIALENSMPEISNMCSGPDELKEIFEEFPALYFTFDVVHATIASPLVAMSFIEELCDKIINVHVGAPHNGKPHFASHRNRNMGTVLKALRDSGYDGNLTIEIDDKTYSRKLSRKDKVQELIRERKYLESIFE